MQDPAARTRGRLETLGRKHRLRESALFEETYRMGFRHVGRHMVLWVRSGPDSSLRLGVVSSRKIGGAVDRNRARRRLRELFRRNRAGLREDVDLVLVARRGAVSAPFEALRTEWFQLVKRAGLLADKKPATESVHSGEHTP